MRFAPIIRVSTEKQKQKGESLQTQEKQIRQYVGLLGGTIPDHCWRYKGQEHATPDQERALLDRLLADSGKGLFDAVICCDASRWSRDNLKSKVGLKILKQNGIRFFVATTEYDLNKPEHTLYLGLSAEIGEFHAREQTRKSIENRIERAKKDIPSCGKLPYGRTFDKKTGTWGIDKAKQGIIKQAAKRYLSDEHMRDIALTLKMNHANLWKILTRTSGDQWPVRFQAKDLNIDETVVIKIPPLLDEQTIAAIHEKAEANKTFAHGEIKHHYLLSRMIFCAKCGYVLFGQTNHGVSRFYRHPGRAIRRHHCGWKDNVPAALIENAVLVELIRTFGDHDLIEQAIKAATPDAGKIAELTEERVQLDSDRKDVLGARERLVENVANGRLSDKEIETQIGKLRVRLEAIDTRLAIIDSELKNAPDPKRIKRLSKFAIQVLADNSRFVSVKKLKRMSYVSKRRIVKHAFGGKDANGQRLGVCVSETGDARQPWQVEFRGSVEGVMLGLPLSDDYLWDVFGLNPEDEGSGDKLKQIKRTMTKFETKYALSTRCI